MYTNLSSMGNEQEEAMVEQESCNVVTIKKMWWDDLQDWSAAMDGKMLFR